MENAIVIKIGSSLLTSTDNQLNLKMIESIAMEVSALRQAGKRVVIVSSGAVASGRTAPSLSNGFPVSGDRRLAKILREQILAAVGQPLLMHAYQLSFEKYGLVCAQILVTRADFADRNRYLNLRTVVDNLLQLSIVPIVNENDVLSTEELDDLDFTDNDQLSCMVAAMIGAERLLILTNVPGLMDRSPKDPEAKVLPEVKKASEARDMIQNETSGMGKGGMESKLEAADLITSLGISMQIVSGHESQVITRVLLKGERLGTFFPAQDRKVSPRKAWIGAAAVSRGKITVSTYLADLLRARHVASILLRGVDFVDPDETFKTGDVVSVFDENGQELGRGEVRYNADELRRLMQERDRNAERTAGGEKLVIHYDYFVFA
ncbi:MAG: glutamate 5-kinase [Patescibacteria group bacterium]|nr:glutamate 5-kinase [Patescibacteria group bacterium]